jgi:hypothetical protein
MVGTAVLLGLFSFSAGPAWAQQNHVVDPAAMQKAIAEQIAVDDANREVVKRALQRDDVRKAASQMGLDVVRAERALATLDSAELARLAAPAQAITADRTGGDTVVISVTTLLLLLILIVLLLK